MQFLNFKADSFTNNIKSDKILWIIITESVYTQLHSKFNTVDFENLKRFVILPIIFGFSLYALMKLSYYVFDFVFGQSGIAFIFEMAVFCSITSLLVPKLILSHYGEDLWQIIKITKENWSVVIISSLVFSLFFIHSDSLSVLSVTFSRTGLGKLSFGSLIQAPVFEEFLFRGVILGLSLKHLNEKLAIGLNGVLFGIWHIGAFFKYGFVLEVILLVLTTVVYGYLLAKIQHHKKNLLIPIGLHALATFLVALTGFPVAP